MTAPRTTASRLLRRLRVAAADASYAQQRLFELRTGVTLTEVQRRRERRAEIAALEALFARPSYW